MKQVIPASRNGLLSSMNIAINGGTTNSATVTLTHNTVAVMTTRRTEAVTAQAAVVLTKEELHDLRELLETERVAAREFVMLGRDQLKPALGRVHSPTWAVAGFSGSMAIPTKAGDLEVLLEKFKKFLTDNPNREVGAHEITAEKAGLRYTALKNARAAVKAKEGTLATRLQECDAKFAVLKQTLWALVKELSQILTPLDGRWTSYGFNKPGAKQRPEAPTNVSAVLIGPNAISVKWDRAARAEYYRVWKRTVGVDDALGVVSSKHDLDIILEGLQPNSLIEIAVTAMNNGGESPKSQVVAVSTT
ncbi:MAG: fibronectin type III domain-containing protein [Limisphaerales bacterium]